MIEYSLLPLYDPALPLESFMSGAQARRFRTALRDATEASWAALQACSAQCTAGYCSPRVDWEAATVAYSCSRPGEVADTAPAPLSVTDMAREMTARRPLAMSSLPLTGSIQLLQVGAARSRQAGRQGRAVGGCG